MKIAVTCRCGAPYQVDEKYRGTAIPCGNCGQAVLVRDVPQRLSGELHSPTSPVSSSAAGFQRMSAVDVACMMLGGVVGLALILLLGIVANSAAHGNRQSDLQERSETAESATSTTRGIPLPNAIEDLNDPLREKLLAELREQFETGDETRKLALAYALADYGDVRIQFLLSQVENVTPSETDKLVSALGRSSTEAVAALESAARTADREQKWRFKARLALLTLYLNAFALAQEMCELRPDPIQRTLFIEEWATWHGDLSVLAGLVAECDVGTLRSAVSLAVGSVPAQDVSDSGKQAWQPVLSNWYKNAPDTVTHSASGWALRQWKLELPNIAQSKQLEESHDWHVNSVGMTMLKIPAGSFVRKDANDNDAIEQTVTLTRPFLLSDCEVTRAQFQQFIDDPDYPDFPDPVKPKNWPGAIVNVSPTEQHPVQQVSWYDAVLFCNWLSNKEGLTVCYERTGGRETIGKSRYDAWRLIPETNGYHLPTEAEWEYACRAGTETAFSSGDEDSLLERYAVISSKQTELPGSKLPNGCGLFDVHGNVSEWCQDSWGPYGSEAMLSDPIGSNEVSVRVLRGGSFITNADLLRAGSRNFNQPGDRNHCNGFRLARAHP